MSLQTPTARRPAVGGSSRGTRFRPLSLDVPKVCMSPIHEVYLIGYYEESVFHDFIKSSTTESDICCSFLLNEMLKLSQENDAEAVILGTPVREDAASNFGCIVSDAHTRRVLHYVEKPESHISNMINCRVYLFSTDAIFPSIRSAIKRRADRPSRLVSYPSSENLEISFMIDDDNDENRKNEVIRLELPAPPSRRMPCISSKCDRTGQTKELATPLENILGPLGPNVSIGPRVTIGAGARVKESIVLEDSEIKHDACVLYSISRVDGVEVQAITILGKEFAVGDEIRVQNCICLPFKELKRDVANEVIM
ncbi:hypothetical protein B0H63DRAFT_498185 [Podospora didyma]|uniref:Mannose-1-phosphate guanyltransferase n=1 Tax=Podospora didyma TaxID=330526 RepID=A0AAE0JYQ0_9PEZI|nr:hypothetical protein B0H63DRAFT_498185 [Podospora didyma]